MKALNLTFMIFIALMCSLSLLNFTHANETDRASVLVLDASGSMWKQLEAGKTRIEIARDVMADYLMERNQNIPLGVVTYGHRRKGDCADIEVIAPLEKQDGKVLAERINIIAPKGKTPLTDALALAVEQIPKTSEAADIILITDGLETCDKDPCALAREIAAEGIDIRAHVVGFGLTKKEAASLACITEATGGHLLRPQSGKELADALKVVTTEPEESKPSTLPVKIGITTAEGTARPAWVEFSAKNLVTGGVKTLGKRKGAQEVLEPFSTELENGQWLLQAKGELGEGKLEITLSENETYFIPYQAEKPAFSFLNYGPYQLGQMNAFFIQVNEPIQENATYSAALFPVDAKAWSDNLGFSYLTSDKTGIQTVQFESPVTSGKYKIIITPEYLEQAVASFELEFTPKATPKIVLPERVKPGETFNYQLYGNWYPNNPLKLRQEDQEISSVWISETVGDNGLTLTAPEKPGVYQVVYHFDDHQGNRQQMKLSELRVGKAEATPPTEASQASDSEEQTNADVVKNEADAADNEFSGTAPADDVLLYDLEKNKDLLLFTCEAAECVYDDIETGLSGIPLIKDWAIEQPYFYTTAGGAESEVPTIQFVNTRNGLWFILNGRQISEDIANCFETGKEGRNSSEEQICSVKTESSDESIGAMVRLIEQVEAWRYQSYRQ